MEPTEPYLFLFLLGLPGRWLRGVGGGGGKDEDKLNAINQGTYRCRMKIMTN
uniref:Uncharacterized protein n=1 Tax=Rhizophora mucronata TaxID=61149 RepID=A0A2P2J0M2_RHIMU